MIPGEIEQTVSDYATQRIDIRAGNALISADPGVGIRCQISRPAQAPLTCAGLFDWQTILVGRTG